MAHVTVSASLFWFHAHSYSQYRKFSDEWRTCFTFYFFHGQCAPPVATMTSAPQTARLIPQNTKLCLAWQSSYFTACSNVSAVLATTFLSVCLSAHHTSILCQNELLPTTRVFDCSSWQYKVYQHIRKESFITYRKWWNNLTPGHRNVGVTYTDRSLAHFLLDRGVIYKKIMVTWKVQWRKHMLIRPPDISVSGLIFYRDSFFFLFFAA